MKTSLAPLSRIIIHLCLWGGCVAILFFLHTKQILGHDLFEEVIWLFLSISFTIEGYNYLKKTFLLFACCIYIIGLTFDVLDGIPSLLNTNLLHLDTSLKNIGFLFIYLGLLRLIQDKRKIIKQLNLTLKDKNELQQKLIYEAHHDPLTGLGNRRALFSNFKLLCRSNASLLYFDLDNFKKANDQYGHQAGDKLLTLFAQALTECFKHQHCFRIGGDEFIALSRTHYNDIQLAKLISQLQPSIAYYQVGISIGQHTLTEDAELDHCLHSADIAMYRFKNKYKNTSIRSAKRNLTL